MRWLRAGSCEACGLLGNLWDKRQPCRHWINRAYTLILNKALDTKLYQASLSGETMWSLLGTRGGNTGHSSMRKGWLESLFSDLPFCPSHLFLWVALADIIINFWVWNPSGKLLDLKVVWGNASGRVGIRSGGGSTQMLPPPMPTSYDELKPLTVRLQDTKDKGNPERS